MRASKRHDGWFVLHAHDAIGSLGAGRPLAGMESVMTRGGMALFAMIGVVAGSTPAASVRAQNAPIQATPLPPLQEQTQPYGAAPVAPRPAPGPSPQAFPVLPGTNAQGQTSPVTPPATSPPATVERGNAWVPAGVAKLQALDKANAQTGELTIKVGQSGTFGSLTISVKSCMVRPPDQPADAAVYLDIKDSHPDSPGFDGWILQDEPSVSMMQHPIYDIRVTGCT
jgi:hypothetical protein